MSRYNSKRVMRHLIMTSILISLQEDSSVSHRVNHQMTAFLAGIQWLGFMFANTVVIPLSVGSAMHLSPPTIAGVMARSFIFTGIACLLQVIIGHRLPLMEGQSGLWWGVILSLASLGSAKGASMSLIGGSLATGMLIGGVLIVLIGVTGLYRLLNRLFTPMVMAVLLLLLSVQLIDIFFRGMIGADDASGHMNLGVSLLSITLVALVGMLTLVARGVIGNFSILIGITVGWILYVLLFHTSQRPVVPTWHGISEVFVWGHPALDVGIVVTTIFAALINTTNTIATLRASESLFETSVEARQFRKSFTLTGLFTVASGVFSVVPYAPYTSSIGFLRTTRLLARAPFIIGAVLFTMLGFIPPLAGFFSTLPISVGDAVLFVAYLQLFGAALQNIEGMRFTFKSIFRIALPSLLGLAILASPSQTFSTLPPYLQPLISNGMLIGILLSILLENTINWKRLDAQK